MPTSSVNEITSFLIIGSLFIFKNELVKLWAIPSLPLQFVLVHNITNFPEKRPTYFFVLIFIVVQNAITIYINDRAQHKLNLIGEVHDISTFGQKAIRPSWFIKAANIGRGLDLSGAEKEKFAIAIKIFAGIITWIGAFRRIFRHVLIKKSVIRFCEFKSFSDWNRRRKNYRLQYLLQVLQGKIIVSGELHWRIYQRIVPVQMCVANKNFLTEIKIDMAHLRLLLIYQFIIF